MFIEKVLDTIYIEFHMFVKCVTTLTAEHGESQDASSAGRKLMTVFYHATTVENKHWDTVST